MTNNNSSDTGLSPLDDYPIHQVADVIRHVGSSDRNFYDRYYFCMHNSSDELFMVMGLGQYPNLGVQDAFAVVRKAQDHYVVRASRELGLDRGDISVGPFRVEVMEGLQRVRYILEPTEHDIAMDVEWQASMPAWLEPDQVIRRHGRLMFDTKRFAQTGTWKGTLNVGGTDYQVTPDRWLGARDRSWGIRPVGEYEPPGIHAGSAGSMRGMWNYFPMRFDDFSIIYMCNEEDDGTRMLEEAVRIWRDPARGVEYLGRPEHDLQLGEEYGRPFVTSATVRFPDAPSGALEVKATPLTHVYVMVGTGYGLESDWKHGMYKGKEVVEGFRLDMDKDKDRMMGLVDAIGRYEIKGGPTGYGLFEWGFLGPFKQYGIS